MDIAVTGVNGRKSIRSVVIDRMEGLTGELPKLGQFRATATPIVLKPL